MTSYANKTALVVGGSHGVGLSTAEYLLNRGAKVLITGRSPGPIQSAQEKLCDKAKVIPCDITSTDEISDLAKTAESYFGSGASLDFLFLNAGYCAVEPFPQVTEATFRRQFDTNVFGAFFVAQKLASIIKPGGSIVFTASVSNQVGMPGMAIYSATKAAVQSLVQTLAAELADNRVRVNAVSLGFIKTPTMGISGSTPEEQKEFEALGVKSTPLGRVGDAEEVAKAVAILAFDATFTTGSQIVVDGGIVVVAKH